MPDRLRILVVVDDRIAARDLRATLERLGHEVIGPAETGGQGLELAASRPPALALVDLRLRGEIDGIAAACALKRRHGLPVLFLVGASAEALFPLAIAAAPAGYLRRPCSDAELEACLAAAARREIGPASPADSPPLAEPPARGTALAKAAELSRQESFRELLGPRALAREHLEADDSPSFFDEVAADSGDPPFSGPGCLSPLDAIGDPLVALDREGRVTRANAEALAYFGGALPLIGRELRACFDAEAAESWDAEIQEAAASGDRRHRAEFHDASRGRWLEVSFYRAGGGEGDAVLVLFQDVTGRKRSDAAGLRLQRLEGLGLLARGFAHDFNNLLTVLIGSLELAEERHPDEAEFREEMGHASSAASAARDLVQQLLTFAQGGRPIREEIRLASLLRQILAERRLDHPGIRYQFQSSEPDLVAAVDRRQITRLIENLVTNAEQAMPGGGVLIARCQRISGTEACRLSAAPAAPAEDHALVEIIDTGRGMTPEELDRAFDPYYTTRASVNASGIGLTVCESIAKAHGGFVLLQSKEGRGTIATLCLPLREQPFPAAAGSPARNVFMPPHAAPPAGLEIPPLGLAAPPGTGGAARFAADPLTSADLLETVAETRGGGRILVLEDDSLIRRLIAVTLRRDGHEVTETADGRDTLRLYREAMEAGQPFDLVLSDLTIEHGLGGVETMRGLREMDPGVLAVVSSGYSDAPAMARPESFGFSAVLPKPYPPRELRALVQQLLQRRRPGQSASSPA